CRHSERQRRIAGRKAGGDGAEQCLKAFTTFSRAVAVLRFAQNDGLEAAFSTMTKVVPLVRVAVWLFALGLSAHAQQLPIPQLKNVFPCGAQQGKNVEVEIGGGNLD